MMNIERPTFRARTRVLPLLLAALFITPFVGCDRAANPPTADLRYLALGDSYTIGESVNPDQRWPVQLAQRLRGAHINVADPEIIATTGWTTDELSAGIDAAHPAGPYRLVTLLIGVNNQFRGRTTGEFRLQLHALLTRAVVLADARPSRVIVVSIPDYGVTPFAASLDGARIGREIDQFNDVCREEAATAGAAFVDITPGSRVAATDRSLVAGDGLHPSAKLYQRWADAILSAAERAMSH